MAVIEILKRVHCNRCDCKFNCNGCYYGQAIIALEKQIPKKILYRKQNYGTPWLCCECEADQTPTEFFSTDGSEPKEKHTFCWKCGQKLDWGDYK